MYCMNCRAQLPDNARFCYACGQPIAAGGASPPPPPPPPPPSAAPGASATVAPAGVQELKCPSCGAPIHPGLGETVISCEYCGGSVTLGGAGWKGVNRHSMLALKVADVDAALRVIHAHVDAGLFHRKEFESSTVTEQKLSFVPFWVVPVCASTNYVYTDVAVGIGGTVATIAASEALGSALGGRRGGWGGPVIVGAPMNASRQDSITGQYEFPVIAVKALEAYQPKEYRFDLADRVTFDKRQVPAGTPLLNGDLDEEASKHAADAFVRELQSAEAHKRHRLVSQLQTTTQVSDPELLHAPIWRFALERKDHRTLFLLDASAGRVIRTVT